MKARLFICLALLPCWPISAQETYPAGIVYGPKAAFSIAAPEGWVLDNTSGADQGLPCVLYPKGFSWSDARTIMYAKICRHPIRRRERICRDGDQGDAEDERQTERKD